MPLFQVPFVLSPRGSPAPSAPSSREHFCLHSGGWEEWGMLRTAKQQELRRSPEQQTSSDLPSTRGACLAHPRASAPDSSLALRGLEPELLRYARLLGEEAGDQDCSLCNVAITRRSLQHLQWGRCSASARPHGPGAARRGLSDGNRISGHCAVFLLALQGPGELSGLCEDCWCHAK